jgi:hypothetical protein
MLAAPQRREVRLTAMRLPSLREPVKYKRERRH